MRIIHTIVFCFVALALDGCIRYENNPYVSNTSNTTLTVRVQYKTSALISRGVVVRDTTTNLFTYNPTDYSSFTQEFNKLSYADTTILVEDIGLSGYVDPRNRIALDGRVNFFRLHQVNRQSTGTPRILEFPVSFPLNADDSINIRPGDTVDLTKNLTIRWRKTETTLDRLTEVELRQYDSLGTPLALVRINDDTLNDSLQSVTFTPSMLALSGTRAHIARIRINRLILLPSINIQNSSEQQVQFSAEVQREIDVWIR